VLELLVYPAICAWWRGRKLPEPPATIGVAAGIQP